MRFVAPETVKVDIGDGDWIEIKKELNVGEENKYRTAGMKNMSNDGGKNTIAIDWEKMSIARVVAYLFAWSVVGKNGKPVPVTEDKIASLSRKDFKRIDDAIKAHIDAQDQEKNETSDDSETQQPSQS